MKKCKYYKEESPSFILESDGFEIEMIPVCLKKGLKEMGAASDVVFCNGDAHKCFLKELSQEDPVSGSDKNLGS